MGEGEMERESGREDVGEVRWRGKWERDWEGGSDRGKWEGGVGEGVAGGKWQGEW